VAHPETPHVCSMALMTCLSQRAAAGLVRSTMAAWKDVFWKDRETQERHLSLRTESNERSMGIRHSAELWAAHFEGLEGLQKEWAIRSREEGRSA
jgi:hypothetical protein